MRRPGSRGFTSGSWRGGGKHFVPNASVGYPIISNKNGPIECDLQVHMKISKITSPESC